MAYIAPEQTEEEKNKQTPFVSKPIDGQAATGTVTAPAAPVAAPGGQVQAATAKPLNRSYEIAKGLLSGKQSAAQQAGVNAATQTAGTQMTSDMNAAGEKFVKDNTLADYDAAAGFAAWKADPNSESGKAFAAKLGASKEAIPTGQYNQSGGYIGQVAAPKRGGTVGMRALDNALTSNEQMAGTASLVGQQNQAIGELMAKQTGLSDQVKAAYAAKLGTQQDAGKGQLTAEEAAINQAALDAGTVAAGTAQQAADARAAELGAKGDEYNKSLTDIYSKMDAVSAELKKAEQLEKGLPGGGKLPIAEQLRQQLGSLAAAKDSLVNEYDNYNNFTANENARFSGAVTGAPKSVMNSSQADLINRMRSLTGATGNLAIATPDVPGISAGQFVGGTDLSRANELSKQDYVRLPGQQPQSTSISSQVGGAVEPIVKDFAKTAATGGLNKVSQSDVDTAVTGGLNKVAKSNLAKKIKKWF